MTQSIKCLQVWGSEFESQHLLASWVLHIPPVQTGSGRGTFIGQLDYPI